MLWSARRVIPGGASVSGTGEKRALCMIRHIARSGATRSIPTFAATLLVAAGFVMIGALADSGRYGCCR